MALSIDLDGIGKRYSLGVGGGYRTLRESIGTTLRRNGQRAERDEVWALRDISLELEEGSALGVVGRNGAGKTTLLRILARITEPSTGRAHVRGRVGALLEVGTGFHPELTGAENVYLGGAVLGMKRREVRRRFDEIVAFADVERFIDTPIKRYSAGMYLRLAFSVAAHLDSEILLVDEVLAVGDAEFQRRCLGKVEELGGAGRTVLFVSHDPGSVVRLCDRAVWLDSGRVRGEGAAEAVVGRYLEEQLSASVYGDLPLRAGPVVLENLEIISEDGQPISTPRRDLPLRIRILLRVVEREPRLDVAVYVVDSRGRRVIDDALSDHATPTLGHEAGLRTVVITIPPILRAVEYGLGLWIGTPGDDYLDREVITFELAPRPDDASASLRRERVVVPAVRWDVAAG